MNKELRRSNYMTKFLIIVVFLYILSSSIAVPLLFKQFYYIQIDDLNVEQDSGLTREQIVTAYSEVIDYCIGTKKDFSAGGLGYSEEGKAHFEDCRKLFILDLIVFFISVFILFGFLLIRNKIPIKCDRPKNHGAGYWGAFILLISVLVIGGLGAIDFDKTFVIFHAIFFPGKDNWVFNPEVDEIINILPETFFMRCALLIAVLILLQCLVFITADMIGNRKKRKRQSKD